LDWRTRAEVDEKALIDLLLRSEAQTTLTSEVSDEENDEEEADDKGSEQ
jgi:hypothetical protein